MLYSTSFGSILKVLVINLGRVVSGDHGKWKGKLKKVSVPSQILYSGPSADARFRREDVIVAG